MKTILYITIIATLGCSNETKHTHNTTEVDTIPKSETVSKIDKSKYYTKQDTLFIPTEIGKTLKYSKEEFNKIVDNFPALYNGNIQDPDQIYYGTDIWKDIIDKDGNKKHLTFGNEVGQDEYYMLYAYFLKQKNGVEKYKERRKRLIDIYSSINSLFGYFEYGGTFFGHQSARILGYAEYSVYLYIQNEKYISKTYNISKQKELYIKSLRQLIEDESKIDFNTMGKDKIKRNKELNRIVDNIDKAITDNYYLKRTQEFQYRHYNYY